MLRQISFTLLFTISASAISQNLIEHTTTKGNTRGHITTLNHPAINGQSDKIMIVSQLYGKYNDHPIGVWYNNGNWTVYNEDRISLPMATKFNVLAVDPSENAFQHMVRASNMTKTWTVLNHPLTNNNPDAVIMVTQIWKGVYNPEPIGVWYDGAKWCIFNQNNKSIPEGTVYNVMVLTDDYVESIYGHYDVFNVTAESKQNRWGDYLALIPITGQNIFLFETQNWSTAGPYNDHVPAVWYGGSEWTIYNQDRVTLSDNVKFNLLAFPK